MHCEYNVFVPLCAHDLFLGWKCLAFLGISGVTYCVQFLRTWHATPFMDQGSNGPKLRVARVEFCAYS